ncbi:MAG: cupin domain-containing protein [Acidimicrobiia bacterium]
MRYLITGVDAAGRSCVVEEKVFDHAVDAVTVVPFFATSAAPPPPRPDGTGESLDLGVAPGMAQWMIVQWGPNATTAFHHTDTVDFDTCLSGRLWIILHDGEHLLEPGDCVLVNGVDHGWRTGDERATSGVVLLGSARR